MYERNKRSDKWQTYLEAEVAKEMKMFSKTVLRNLKAVNFVVWDVITKYFMLLVLKYFHMWIRPVGV